MDEKERLIESIEEVTGSVPVELRRVLKILSHPAIVPAAKRYFESIDITSMCLKYEAPWNCAREAEARYENLKYGWLGSANNSFGYSDWWCENCRKKVMGT